MRFNLIGPFEILTADGRSHLPSTPKVCQTLALLLTRPKELVTSETLIRELWGECPPKSALTTLQTYIYHARKMFVNEGVVPPEKTLLATRPPGYVIEAEDEEVDVKIFERLIAKGQTCLQDGRPESALEHLRQALGLWRGPALSNIPAGDVLRGRIVHLEELRIRALRLRIEAETQLGQQHDSIPELRVLVNEYPLNEWFHGRLISALNHSGRRAEALQAYRTLHRILDEELGLEPAPELQRLQLEVLNPSPTARPTRLRLHGPQEHRTPSPVARHP